MPKRKHTKPKHEPSAETSHEHASKKERKATKPALRVGGPGSVDAVGSSDSGDLELRRPRRVRFDDVTVYHFDRAISYDSVPTAGGCILGMADKHHHEHQFSLRHAEPSQVNVRSDNAVVEASTESSEAEVVEEQPAKAAKAKAKTTNKKDRYYMKPLKVKERKHLLSNAGISDLSKNERKELQMLRESRSKCGCDCRNRCLPATCECALNNIKCQVETEAFPCACSHESCKNPHGRVALNYDRVRSHYWTTLKRLKLEAKRLSEGTDVRASPTHTRFSHDD